MAKQEEYGEIKMLLKLGIGIIAVIQLIIKIKKDEKNVKKF